MYSCKDYWANLAEGCESRDALGFAPILHPQAPLWFNQVIDNLQCRAVRRALAIAATAPGARLLDVGCGTGRWVRRYKELGFSPGGWTRRSVCFASHVPIRPMSPSPS